MVSTGENVRESDSVPNRELNDSMPTNSENGNNDVGVAASSSNLVPTEENVLDVKPELHVPQRADLAEIDAILHGDDSESDDEIEITVLGNGDFPLPVQYSYNELVKREDDPISGNLPYNNAPQVCIIEGIWL